MSWETIESYQELVKMHPDLQVPSHREAFHQFLDRMWTKPNTLIEFSKAYMEFTTADQLTFPKLRILAPEPEPSTPPRSNRSRRSRRSRSRRSRKAEN
jgi:hypothetical protein